jgi:hypothetical protein
LAAVKSLVERKIQADKGGNEDEAAKLVKMMSFGIGLGETHTHTDTHTYIHTHTHTHTTADLSPPCSGLSPLSSPLSPLSLF